MMKKVLASYGGIFVLLVSFVVYLQTLTPTVGLHDSGDMITSAYVLGIAHPPGYPFYTLFGKLWMTVIPIGNIAFRMNMLSALFASLAVMMVYFITLKLTTEAQRGDKFEIRNSKFETNPKFKIQNPEKKPQINANERRLNLQSVIPVVVAVLIFAFSTTFWEQAVC